MALSHGRATTRSSESGFSLVELMVAMTVTLIITGAVFQLISAGQSAFRREPALADRQQNIRMALNIISQDIYRTGYGIPQFAQAFTDDLDGDGPAGSGGEDTDFLEMFMASECPNSRVCPVIGNASKSVTTFEVFSSCYTFPSLVLMADQATWAMRWAEEPGAGTTSNCSGAPAGSKHGHAVFPPGKAPIVNPTGGFAGWQPEYMMIGLAVRYRINIDADGTPNLERSAAGGQTDPKGNSTWEVIARGVEDLQVEYLNGAGWQDEPGLISCGANCGNPTQAEYDTLVRRVRVRLSARVVGEANLTGQTTSAVGNGVRGTLVTEVAPRAATATLGMFGGEL